METFRAVSCRHRYGLELKTTIEFRNNIFQLKVRREVCDRLLPSLLLSSVFLPTLPFYTQCPFLFFLFHCYSCLVHPLSGFYYMFSVSCPCLISCLQLPFIAVIEHPLPQSTPLSRRCYSPSLLLSLSGLFSWSYQPHRPTHLLLLQLPFKFYSEIFIT